MILVVRGVVVESEYINITDVEYAYVERRIPMSLAEDVEELITEFLKSRGYVDDVLPGDPDWDEDLYDLPADDLPGHRG